MARRQECEGGGGNILEQGFSIPEVGMRRRGRKVKKLDVR